MHRESFFRSDIVKKLHADYKQFEESGVQVSTNGGPYTQAVRLQYTDSDGNTVPVNVPDPKSPIY